MSFGSTLCKPLPHSIATRDEGSEEEVDSQARAGIISLPEAGGEGWMDRRWRLGFLGSRIPSY